MTKSKGALTHKFRDAETRGSLTLLHPTVPHCIWVWNCVLVCRCHKCPFGKCHLNEAGLFIAQQKVSTLLTLDLHSIQNLHTVYHILVDPILKDIYSTFPFTTVPVIVSCCTYTVRFDIYIGKCYPVQDIYL